MNIVQRLLLALRLQLYVRRLRATYSSETVEDLLGEAPVFGPLVRRPQGLPGFPAPLDEPRVVSWRLNVDPYDPDVPSGLYATDAELEVRTQAPASVSDDALWDLPAEVNLIRDGAAIATRRARNVFHALAWMIAADEVYCRHPEDAFGWRSPPGNAGPWFATS